MGATSKNSPLPQANLTFSSLQQFTKFARKAEKTLQTL